MKKIIDLFVLVSCKDSAKNIKLLVLFFLLINVSTMGYSQIEVNGSFSGTSITETKGFGLNLGYEIPFVFNEKLGLKPQIGYKCNCGFEKRSDVDLANKIIDLHTTLFYKIIEKPTYKLIPNVGINLRYSTWSAEFKDKDVPPKTFYSTGVRGQSLSILSNSEFSKAELDFLTPGFSFQAQNRFLLNESISINVTPFIESDTRGEQATGGAYFGITYFK